MRMTDPLSPLVADGIIDQVLSRLKSGKEADIYLVQRAGEVLAAKVYKDRHVRSFQNNAAYKEGRAVRNSRTQRAMQKGSRFGRDSDEQAWKAKESEALHTLFAAGVRVPKPHLLYEGVLIMEVVIDAEGRPAPRLIDADIPAEQAADLYADLRHQVVTLLRCDLIHGDLSPYNVLMAWNGPTLIDFPQVIGAAHNSQAERFFRRDLDTIRQFFVAKGAQLDGHAMDSEEIWRAYVRRELTPEFVPRARAAPAGKPSAPSSEGHRKHRHSTPRGPEKGPSSQRKLGGRGQPSTPRAPSPPRAGPAPTRGAARGPIVSYVGRSTPAPASPSAPASAAKKRRRRRRHGRGRPPPQ
jgi:RIO kinase 1